MPLKYIAAAELLLANDDDNAAKTSFHREHAQNAVFEAGAKAADPARADD